MNAKVVQRRLWEQSQEHKRSRETEGTLFAEDYRKRRIRKLSDLMHNPDWLRAACDKVLSRSSGKAAGVDKESVHKFKQKLENKLESLRLEIKHGAYQPQPVRRVMIDKGNGKLRPLGIPCLRDKIVQEAIRMALEPIYEVEFHDNSYGFRPHRNAHHAVFRCQQMIRNQYSWVIEGDVKACFDEISHKSILKCIREKVMDNKFLNLIVRFLKAGFQYQGNIYPTEEGVPQGGVLSPLLANIVLNRLDWFLHDKGKEGNAIRRAHYAGQRNIKFTRYADDWCVFITRCRKKDVVTLKEEISRFLKHEINLQLSVEKTKVTHVRDGFDFLGFNLSYGKGQKGRMVPKIKIGQKALKNIRRNLDKELRYCAHQESMAMRIQRTSMVIRGWSEYFRIAHDLSKRAGMLDDYALWSAVKAACRKYDITTGQCFRKYYRNYTFHINSECSLKRFTGTTMKHDYHKPEEYVPGCGKYLENEIVEPSVPAREWGRKGSADMRWQALRRDEYKCQICGRDVTSNTAHVDHIIPVKRFASFMLASALSNLQTLCLRCHKNKSKSEYHAKNTLESRML